MLGVRGGHGERDGVIEEPGREGRTARRAKQTRKREREEMRMDEPTYRSPEPYIREGRELMNSLDGHRQQIALDLGDEHPLFELVDRALRSADIDRLRVARAAVLGWRDLVLER